MLLLVTIEHIGTKQLAPGPLPYTNWLPDSDIIPSSMLHVMHSNVLSYTIWPSGPRVFWGNLVTLFWILILVGSWNLKFLVIISCSSHPRTSFQICNTKGLILKRHHATIVKIVINKQKSREPTIPTELVQKHAKKILPGNGKAITNFNILAKTSLGQRFTIPYLVLTPCNFPKAAEAVTEATSKPLRVLDLALQDSERDLSIWYSFIWKEY
jgi:hypothetical protein